MLSCCDQVLSCCDQVLPGVTRYSHLVEKSEDNGREEVFFTIFVPFDSGLLALWLCQERSHRFANQRVRRKSCIELCSCKIPFLPRTSDQVLPSVTRCCKVWPGVKFPSCLPREQVLRPEGMQSACHRDLRKKEANPACLEMWDQRPCVTRCCQVWPGACLEMWFQNRNFTQKLFGDETCDTRPELRLLLVPERCPVKGNAV